MPDATVDSSDADTDADSDSDTGSSTDTDDCSFADVVENCGGGWCEVLPGCFIHGSPESEPCRAFYAEKQVQITLTGPFLTKQTEVTRAEWIAAGFPDPSYGAIDLSAPVNVVNWFDALAYCNAMSEAEGFETCYDLSECTGEVGSGCPEPEPFECTVDTFNCDGPVRKYPSLYDCPGYRLATTAEWEYAARAGTTTATYNGDVTTDNTSGCVSDPPVDPIAWHCGLTDHAMPVALKQPNGWGLFDMLGNAGEWIDYVYTGLGMEINEGNEGPFTDPSGAAEDLNPRRSIRGGGWGRKPCNVRSADHAPPFGYRRSNFYGFRPVRTIFSERRTPARTMAK